MALLRVGHVVVKMRDLESAKRFYGEIVGMSVVAEYAGGVFFRFHTYHHDLAVVKVSEEAAAPSADQVGLGHVALVIDSFESLQAMYLRLQEHGVPIRLTFDHGMTKSLYCTDPDGNGIEIYGEVPEVDYLAPEYPFLAGRLLDLAATTVPA